MNPFRPVLFLAAGLLMLASTVIPAPVFGDDFRFTGQLGLESSYDDNILYVPDTLQPKGDAIQTLSAGFSVDHRIPRLNDHIDAAIMKHSYISNDALDTIDGRARMNADYAFTERLSAQANASYDKNSMIDLNLTIGQNPSTSAHRRTMIQTGMRYSLLRTLSADISAFYQRNDYENDAYTDNRSGGATLAMNWKTDAYVPRTTLGLTAGYSSYHYPDSDLTRADYKNIQLTAGWSATERMRFTMNLGGVLTDAYYEYDVQNWTIEYLGDPPVPTPVLSTYTEEYTYRSQGMVGSVNAVFIGDIWRMTLSGAHNIDLASGSDSIIQRSSAGMDISVNITPEFIAQLMATYTMYRSDKDSDLSASIDQDTLSVQPVLKYKLTDYITLNLAYTYNRCEDHDPSLTYNRHIAGLSIEAAYPFFK